MHGRFRQRIKTRQKCHDDLQSGGRSWENNQSNQSYEGCYMETFNWLVASHQCLTRQSPEATRDAAVASPFLETTWKHVSFLGSSCFHSSASQHTLPFAQFKILHFNFSSVIKAQCFGIFWSFYKNVFIRIWLDLKKKMYLHFYF